MPTPRTRKIRPHRGRHRRCPARRGVRGPRGPEEAGRRFLCSQAVRPPLHHPGQLHRRLSRAAGPELPPGRDRRVGRGAGRRDRRPGTAARPSRPVRGRAQSGHQHGQPRVGRGQAGERPRGGPAQSPREAQRVRAEPGTGRAEPQALRPAPGRRRRLPGRRGESRQGLSAGPVPAQPAEARAREFLPQRPPGRPREPGLDRPGPGRAGPAEPGQYTDRGAVRRDGPEGPRPGRREGGGGGPGGHGPRARQVAARPERRSAGAAVPEAGAPGRGHDGRLSGGADRGRGLVRLLRGRQGQEHL